MQNNCIDCEEQQSQVEISQLEHDGHAAHWCTAEFSTLVVVFAMVIHLLHT